MKKGIISILGCLLVSLVVYSQKNLGRHYQTIYASNLEEVRSNVKEAENTLKKAKSGAIFRRAIELLKNAKVADPPPSGQIKNAIDEIIIHTQDQWVNWSDSQFKIAEQNRIKAEQEAARADSARHQANLAREYANTQAQLALKNGKEAEAGKLALLSSSKRANNQSSEALFLAFAALELEGSQKSTEMWRTFGEAALDTLSESILTNEIPVKKALYLLKSDLFIFIHTDNSISLFIPNERTQKLLSASQSDLPQIAISEDGQLIAFTTINYGVNIYNTLEKNSILLGNHNNHIYQLKFSPGNQALASSSRDKTVKIWNIKNPERSKTLNAQQTNVYQLEFTADNRKLIGRSAKRTLLIWNLSSGVIEKEVPAHEIYVKKLVVPKDGELFLTAGSDGKVKTWDLQGKEQFSVDYEQDPLVNAFLPDDYKNVFTLTQSKKLYMSSLQAGLSQQKTILDQEVREIFMVDKDLLASLSNQDIDIFSNQGELVCSFSGHDYLPFSVDHHADSDLYLSVAKDGTAQLWNSQGEVMLTITVDPQDPLNAFFSFDGKGIYYFEKGNKNLKFIQLPSLLFKNLVSNKTTFKKEMEKLRMTYGLLFYEP